MGYNPENALIARRNYLSCKCMLKCFRKNDVFSIILINWDK